MALLKATENKMLNLSLNEDQQNIVNAERKVNAAKRGLDDTRQERVRVTEDAALFGRPADVGELRRLDAREAHYTDLLAACERELADAKAAPARRAAEEKEAAEMIRSMRDLVSEIDSWADRGATITAKAEKLIERVINVGFINRGGWNVAKPAFREASSLLEQLRHFIGTPGDSFADRVAAYRKIGVASAPIMSSPKTTQPLGTYVRSVPLSRQARENSKVRSRLTGHGVETTSEPRS